MDFDLTAGGFSGVVLAGGTAARMDGVDKARVELDGRTLLELRARRRSLDADEVVVVGARRVPTSRPVTFVREDPPRGGPVAGLLAGVDALLRRARLVGVLAVDMPRVTPRDDRGGCADAAEGHDGAFLVDADGRRQLGGRARRRPAGRGAARPRGPARHGAAPPARPPATWPRSPPTATRRATSTPGRTCATSTGDAPMRRASPCRAPGRSRDIGLVNLHDWIDELCDVLDIETEVDEGLILDLARVAAHNVQQTAAPITTYLLGFAAGAGRRRPRGGGEARGPGPGCWPRAGTGPPTHPTPTTSTTRSPTTAPVDHSDRRSTRTDVLGCAPCVRDRRSRWARGPVRRRGARPRAGSRRGADRRRRHRGQPRRHCCSARASTRRRPAPPTSSASSAAARSPPSATGVDGLVGRRRGVRAAGRRRVRRAAWPCRPGR